jgi:hypothetical protein
LNFRKNPYRFLGESYIEFVASVQPTAIENVKSIQSVGRTLRSGLSCLSFTVLVRNMDSVRLYTPQKRGTTEGGE